MRELDQRLLAEVSGGFYIALLVWGGVLGTIGYTA